MVRGALRTIEDIMGFVQRSVFRVHKYGNTKETVNGVVGDWRRFFFCKITHPGGNTSC